MARSRYYLSFALMLLGCLALGTVFVTWATAATAPTPPGPVTRATEHLPLPATISKRLPLPTQAPRLDGHRRTGRGAVVAGHRLPDLPDVDLTGQARLPVPGSLRPDAANLPRPAPPARALSHRRSPLPDAAPARTTGADKLAPWSSDHLLADPTHMDDSYVSLAVSPVSGDLYAVFAAVDLGGTDHDIHIARSQDGGATWTVWEMPSFTQDETMPDIAIDGGGYIHVVWLRDDGYIVRTRSSSPDDPTQWAWIKGLFTDSVNATPSVAVSGAGDFATLFIAASYQEINWDLYQYEWTLVWMYSSNGGQTVSYQTLVPDGYPDLWPDVAIDGGTVHMVNGETDPYTGMNRILLATDGVGGTFNEVEDLSAWTSFNCSFPRVACEGQDVFVVYQHDYDNGPAGIDGDIVYHFSWDGGATVYGPYEMIADEYDSVGPTVYTRDGRVGCLWLEAPFGGDEFAVMARQAGGHGHPDNWGDLEQVSDASLAEPRYHYLDGAAAAGRLHAAWIDRRDYPTQGWNVYTSERELRPNLAGYQPAGWADALVVAMTPGERTSGYLKAGAPAYVSFAAANLGLADATATFRLRLDVDGLPAAAWDVVGGLPVSTYTAVEDYTLTLDAGTHTLTVTIDPLDAVAEDDETDNVVTRSLTWIDGDPQLQLAPNHVTFFADPPAAAVALDEAPPLIGRASVPVVAPELAAALQDKAAGTLLPVVIEPARRLDTGAVLGALAGVDRRQRRALAERALHRALATATADLRPVLDGLVAAGQAADVRELWAAGALSARLSPAAVAALAGRVDVGRLWLDDRLCRPLAAPQATLAPPAGHAAGAGGTDAVADRLATIPWHLTRIGADLVWQQGYDGTGVLVGHLDTGACYDHPDLAGHLWDGGAAWPHHGYDSVDDDDDPYDGDTSSWHGTHTAGLVVGDGTGGTATGAAPGATLMILRTIPGTFTDVTEAIQFAIDQGPVDLLTMSAGWSDPPDDLKRLNRDLAADLLALGIPWFCAAGNGDNLGNHYPVPRDISSPGDCPDPWYGDAGHSAVITVGATDGGDAVWTYSSIGPTVWDIAGTDYADYPWPPGLLKPDICAPGDGVTSTYHTSGYIAYSGTSMATPLAAGGAALLLQASPGADPATLARALETTAVDVGDPGRDARGGAGRIDLPAALAALPRIGEQRVVLRNTGVLPLHVTGIAWESGWLSVVPGTATIDPGDSLSLRLTADPTGLPTGLHFDVVTITSDDPASPHTLGVTLAVGDVTGAPDTPPVTARTVLAGHPNPFNPRTTLAFTLPRDGRVRLTIHDLAGRRVRVLANGPLTAGRHEIVWDGTDDTGRAVPSGTYLARLEGEGIASATRKLALVR